MKVVIAGGGTAGHVFPALALARRLVDASGVEVVFAGTPTGLEATLVPAAGFDFHPIDARPLVRRLSIRAVTAPIAVLRSVARCHPLVDDANVVVGMGGYASAPIVLAAVRSRRPVVLHEQNAVPGLANRLLSRPARVVALSFGEAARMLSRKARSVVTGNPVRDEIASVPERREALAKEALVGLDLEEGRRTILVFGGSQGAQRVNHAAVAAVERLRDRADLQVLLLTGPRHAREVSAALPQAGAVRVRALPFLDRMELAYAVADLVVARAGATTIAEVTACGLGAILVPYPYATGRHQEANARAVQRAGAATILMDTELSGSVLAREVERLVDDPDRLRAMRESASAWSPADPAGALARLVVDVGKGA